MCKLNTCCVVRVSLASGHHPKQNPSQNLSRTLVMKKHLAPYGLVKSLIASLLHSSSFTSDFTALRIRKSSVVRPSRCGVWSISLSHTHTLLRQLSSGSWLGIKLDQTISNLHMPPTAGSERRVVPKTSTTSTTFRSGTPLIAKWSPK